MSMKDRIVNKLALGFIFGAISGTLIVLLINTISKSSYHIATPELAEAIGTEAAVILQTLLSGLYGLVCIGGTEFYRIERWSLLRSTMTHLLCILVSFSIVGLILRWIHFDIPSLLFLLTIAVVYFIIWLIMSLRWKKSIREMNSELEKYKEENSK